MKNTYLAVRKPEHLKGVYSTEEDIKRIKSQLSGVKGASFRMFKSGEEEVAYKWAKVKALVDNVQSVIDADDNVSFIEETEIIKEKAKEEVVLDISNVDNPKDDIIKEDITINNSDVFLNLFSKLADDDNFNFVEIAMSDGNKIGFLTTDILGCTPEYKHHLDFANLYSYYMSSEEHYSNIVKDNNIVYKEKSTYSKEDIWLELNGILPLSKVLYDSNSNVHYLSGSSVQEDIIINVNEIVSLKKSKIAFRIRDKFDNFAYIYDFNKHIEHLVVILKGNN